MLKALLVPLAMVLCCACKEKPQGFLAVFDARGRSYRLDFRAPPDFVFTIKGQGDSVVVDSAGLRFTGKSAVDAGENRFVVHMYEGAWKVFIWTEIESLDRGTLESMKIDRVPFCVVHVVNAAGGFSYPLNREGMSEAERFQASDPILFEKDGKYGYLDTAYKKVAIEPKFDRASPFSWGRARVRVGSKWGFIDPTGRFIAEPRFDHPCTDFGSMGPPNLAMVTVGDKVGVIDRDGRLVIEPKYDSFSGGFRNDTITVRVGKFYGIVDVKGRVIVEPENVSVSRFSEGLAAVQSKKGCGYVDMQGKYVIPPRFKRGGVFSEGRAAVLLESGKVGFIDKTGELRIPATFDAVMDFEDGFAIVGQGIIRQGDSGFVSKWGIIDKNGRIVIPIMYDFIRFYNDGRWEAKLNGEEGYIHKDGRFERD